jgi:hypothetical protein
MSSGSVVAAGEVTPDHGLSSLGLLMQLAGSALAVFMTGILLITLISGAPGGAKLYLYLALILGLGAASGAVQYLGGRAVSAGESQALGKVRRYATIGWIHTAVTIVILSAETPIGFGNSLLLGGVVFGVWPTYLFVVSSRAPYRGWLETGLPETPDRGAEGLAVYMSLFGAIGVVMALFMAQMLIKGEATRAWQGTVLLVAVLLLLVRAGFHVAAGLKGTLREDWAGFQEASERYALAGNIVAVLVGMALLVIVLAGLPQGPQGLAAFVFIGMVTALLLIWPIVVRQFISAMPAARRRGDEVSGPRSAPDRGLTALGWLLLSLGVVGAAFTLMALILGSGPLGAMGGPFADASGSENRTSQLLGLAVAGLQIVAGLSLVAMSATWKAATLAYAAVGAILSVVNAVRQLDEMRGMPFMGDPSSFMILPVIAALVLPVGSGLLVLRGTRRRP